MGGDIGWRTFVWAIIVGMGLHIGWGLIALLIEMAARSVGKA